MNAWYDSTLDDYISVNDLQGTQKHIDWLTKNKLSTTNNNVILYIDSSLLKKKTFQLAIGYGYNNGLTFGIAFSSRSEIAALLAYNSVQPTNNTKLKFVVTEVEPENGHITYTQVTQLLNDAYSILKSFSIPILIYAGRPMASYWKTYLQFSNEINLHCYLKNYVGTSIWNYYFPRLSQITDTCKAINKIIRINLLVSNEPKNPLSGEEFGYNYFKTHAWLDPLTEFKKQFSSNATTDMKKYLLIGDTVIFKVKYGKQLKP